MRTIHYLLEGTTWIFIAVIAVIFLYIITSNMPISMGLRSYLVQSGSMEPTIMTGDIVIVQPQSSYAPRDVVTFKDAEGRIVTHRIADIKNTDGQEVITTRGDANRTDDFDTITPSSIIGKVTFMIPKLGFFVAFGKSLPGLILMIIIPAALFIIDEILKLHEAH